MRAMSELTREIAEEVSGEVHLVPDEVGRYDLSGFRDTLDAVCFQRLQKLSNSAIESALATAYFRDETRLNPAGQQAFGAYLKHLAGTDVDRAAAEYATSSAAVNTVGHSLPSDLSRALPYAVWHGVSVRNETVVKVDFDAPSDPEAQCTEKGNAEIVPLDAYRHEITYAPRDTMMKGVDGADKPAVELPETPQVNIQETEDSLQTHHNVESGILDAAPEVRYLTSEEYFDVALLDDKKEWRAPAREFFDELAAGNEKEEKILAFRSYLLDGAQQSKHARNGFDVFRHKFKQAGALGQYQDLQLNKYANSMFENDAKKNSDILEALGTRLKNSGTTLTSEQTRCFAVGILKRIYEQI